MKKFILLSALIALSACGKEEANAPAPTAQTQAAEQTSALTAPVNEAPGQQKIEKAALLYSKQYWQIEYVIKIAGEQFTKSSAPALSDPKHCAHNIGQEINAKYLDAVKTYETARSQFITLTAATLTDEELDTANKFFTTTKIGYYLSSKKGMEDAEKLVASSPYKDEIVTKLEKTPASERGIVVVDYILKASSPQDVEEYNKFNNSTVPTKLSSLAPQLQNLLQEFHRKSAELEGYGEKVKQACS